jgi:hypothetical protein
MSQETRDFKRPLQHRKSIYFAMAFSVFVEMLNLRIRGKAPEPVKLRRQYVEAQKIGE